MSPWISQVPRPATKMAPAVATMAWASTASTASTAWHHVTRGKCSKICPKMVVSWWKMMVSWWRMMVWWLHGEKIWFHGEKWWFHGEKWWFHGEKLWFNDNKWWFNDNSMIVSWYHRGNQWLNMMVWWWSNDGKMMVWWWGYHWGNLHFFVGEFPIRRLIDSHCLMVKSCSIRRHVFFVKSRVFLEINGYGSKLGTPIIGWLILN